MKNRPGKKKRRQQNGAHQKVWAQCAIIKITGKHRGRLASKEKPEG